LFRDSATTRIVFKALTIVAACAIVMNAQAVAVRTIHMYQRALAPVADRMGMRCRFVPSCSRYAEIAITRDGAARGGWAAIKRIARCGPWTPQGTRDEP
jgi:putative membrane protein insertion efficiency factor